MAFKYAVTEFLVSDENPEPTPMVWSKPESAIQAMACVARILENNEEVRPSEFPQFETRTTKIVIEVTEYLSRS